MQSRRSTQPGTRGEGTEERVGPTSREAGKTNVTRGFSNLSQYWGKERANVYGKKKKSYHRECFFEQVTRRVLVADKRGGPGRVGD